MSSTVSGVPALEVTNGGDALPSGTLWDLGTAVERVPGPAQDFLLRNTGTARLRIQRVVFTTPGDFIIGAMPTLPLELAPRSAVSITLSFSPRTPGLRHMGVHITSDDPEHPQYVFTLMGQCERRVR
ncbi:hypothetical protein JGU66_28065 [Myxococcaceae bacterium JPH2]|nr:hypothetical protein [Myxococcaceae bacterium JPH2]